MDHIINLSTIIAYYKLTFDFTTAKTRYVTPKSRHMPHVTFNYHPSY